MYKYSSDLAFSFSDYLIGFTTDLDWAFLKMGQFLPEVIPQYFFCTFTYGPDFFTLFPLSGLSSCRMFNPRYNDIDFQHFSWFGHRALAEVTYNERKLEVYYHDIPPPEM